MHTARSTPARSAVLSPQLTGVADNASLSFASTLCWACYDVCPVAIDIPSMLVHLRTRVVDGKRDKGALSGERMAMQAAAYAMGDEGRWARALRLARLGRALGRGRDRIAALPPPLGRWTATRDLPLPQKQTFRDWWAAR